MKLRVRLLVAFCALALVPALALMLLELRIGERTLTETVGTVTRLGTAALGDASEAIARSAADGVTRAADQVIAIGVAAIDRSSGAVVGVGRERLETASGQIIDVSRGAARDLSRELMAASTAAQERLAVELIAQASASNLALAQTTGEIAEHGVREMSRRLAQANVSLADDLEALLGRAHQEAAETTKTRLLAELEREPLVNFRLLGQILVGQLVTGRVVDRREGYLAAVDARGEATGGTRYAPGTSLAHLEIVRRALGDPPGVAATMPLVIYPDGPDTYMGVYARRANGAVVIAYNLANAQADRDALASTVGGSFEDLVRTTRAGTRTAIEATTPRLAREAEELGRRTIYVIRWEADRVSQEAAGRMARRASEMARSGAARVALQARDLEARSARVLHADSRQVIARAVAAMEPIGRASARQAAARMKPEAAKAADQVAARLGPQIRQAGARTAGAMVPLAQEALARSRAETLLGGLALLVLAALLAVGASYALSGRIADPIEVAAQLRQAELDRMGKEMEIATRIQRALLPTDLSIREYDLAMDLVTATEVGGDLIDYVPQGDGRFWLAIGDVTGHGLTPGLVMMMAQSAILGQVQGDPEIRPGEVLARVNQVLYHNIRFRLRQDTCMTLQLVRHDGHGRFATAGLHCHFLVHRHATGQVERIATSGVWAGLLPDIRAWTQDETFALEPRDTLVLYTDGLIEARDRHGEQYDAHRLEAALERWAEHPVEELKARILAEVREWVHEQQDDISIIVLRRHEARVPARAGTGILG